MEVSMRLCRVDPIGLGRGRCSGVGFMANVVRGSILVWRGYVCCRGLVCVVVCVPELSVGDTENEQRVENG